LRLTEPELREWVAKALINKGLALGKLERTEESVAVYDEVVRRFGSATELSLRNQVARALANKGSALGKLERQEESNAVYDEVVQRFGASTEPALREQVANAFNSFSFRLLCDSKKALTMNKKPTAIKLLDQALEKIVFALRYMPEAPILLGNQGYILFLQGKLNEAHPILTKAIALGGEKLRQGELEDADIYPLPQDEAFKKLINSL
jgi:tetratricopeptide (TPR) repeat protein